MVLFLVFPLFPVGLKSFGKHQLPSMYAHGEKTENTGNNVFFSNIQLGTDWERNWEPGNWSGNKVPLLRQKGSLASLRRRAISPIETCAGAFAVALPAQVSEAPGNAILISLGPTALEAYRANRTTPRKPTRCRGYRSSAR
jgi:hypothetical protein